MNIVDNINEPPLYLRVIVIIFLITAFSTLFYVGVYLECEKNKTVIKEYKYADTEILIEEK